MGRTKYWKATLVEILLRASVGTSTLRRSTKGQPRHRGKSLQKLLLGEARFPADELQERFLGTVIDSHSPCLEPIFKPFRRGLGSLCNQSFQRCLRHKNLNKFVMNEYSAAY